MRDRLIELISQIQYMGGLESRLADHLLANGVVLLDFAVVTPENRPLITQIANMPLNDVCELIKAKQEGRIITPPCKVGDSIFRVGNGEIWEWLIEHIEIYGDEIGFVDDGENYFTPDRIGKTVFLTKEEAEEKLKELGK